MTEKVFQEEIGMVSSARSPFTWGRRRFGRGIGIG
jgi:hypothetical protein